LGVKLSFNDLYINVVGGLKIEEPGVDLSIAAAILSTERNLALAADAIFLVKLG